MVRGGEESLNVRKESTWQKWTTGYDEMVKQLNREWNGSKKTATCWIAFGTFDWNGRSQNGNPKQTFCSGAIDGQVPIFDA